MASLVDTTITGNFTFSAGRLLSKNTPKLIFSTITEGAYVFSTIFNNHLSSSSFFESRRLYRCIFISGNPAHFHAYRFWLNTSNLTAGSAAQRFVVRDVVECHSNWTGGCAGNPWTSIDNTGFTYRVNPCGEPVYLFVEDVG